MSLLAEKHINVKRRLDPFHSLRTIETHKYNMMQELNLKTTADLIKFAIKHGIVSN